VSCGATYPRDLHPHSFLGSGTSVRSGDLKRQRKKRRKRSRSIRSHFRVSQSCRKLRLPRSAAEAQITLQQASDANWTCPISGPAVSDRLFEGRQAEMQRLATLGQETSGAAEGICDLESSVLAYSGACSRPAEVTAGGHLAQEAAITKGLLSTKPEWLFWRSFWECVRRSNGARQRRSTSPAVGCGLWRRLGFRFRGGLFTVANACGRSGEALPRGYDCKFSYLPAVRALVALNHHDPHTPSNCCRQRFL